VIVIVFFLSAACGADGFIVNGPDKTLDAPSYWIRGAEYLPLVFICDAYGVQWEWDPASRVVDLSKGGSKMRFSVDGYKVYVNGSLSVQERPVLMYKGAVCVPSDFLRTVFNRLFAPPAEGRGPAPQPSRMPTHTIKRIIIDAGHGGYDPGAIGRDGVKEKYIAFDIAQRVKELLEGQGIDVFVTRSDDRFIPLWGRVDVANNAKPDLFVSIHANASRARRLKGFEVYYLSEAIDDDARAVAAAENGSLGFDRNSYYLHSNVLDTILWDLELTENRRDSIDLGNCILDAVGVPKRGLKSARFYVLKNVRVPAVLIEVGYITNTDECTKLGWGEYRATIAEQIVKGISAYKNKFEATDGFTR